MGLHVRFTLPVIILAVLTLAAGMTGTGQGLLPVISVVWITCFAMVLGQVLRLRRFLTQLPSIMKDTVWGRTGAEFPAQTGDDELARFSRDMQDLAFSMREVFEQRAEMEQMAHSDTLTGLPNRRGLNALLTRLSAEHEATQTTSGIGVIHMDLDHFKAVNDRFGHEAGDHVLREATKLISQAIRDSDYLARLGGDEFVIIAPGVDSETILVRIAERVIEQFDAPIMHNTDKCQVGISIGLVLGGMRGKLLDPQRLLLNADVALCQAKANGRNRHAVFSATMARANRRQHSQADEIRNALDLDQFRAWFHPVVDLKSGRTTAFQVVPRWENSAHGFVDPDDFMVTAEAYNMVEELGMRVFEHACNFLTVWRRDDPGVPGLRISMNRAQLLDANVADRISWCLDDMGLQPEDLVVSAAEPHLSGRSSELVIANLIRLRQLGCRLAIEEFGQETGAISNMARLRPTQIVMARNLTEHLAQEVQSHSANALLEIAIGGAKALGCGVVAAGISREEQVNVLKTLGVSQASGPLWAQPVSPQEMRRTHSLGASQTRKITAGR